MSILPIVERELRAGSRKAAPRYIRLAVAAVALAIGLFQLAIVPVFARGGTAGGTAFAFMTGYAFLLCVGAGIFVTADCLSEEKRNGTLGLLFLTDLRGYDIVLGKLASQLIYLGYALLAIIPGAALPLLLGGVTGGELWRICLTLGNLLFFSLAAGVFASSVCRQAGRAMILTATISALFCLGLPLLQSFLSASNSPAVGSWFGTFSPATAYMQADESDYLRATGDFWLALSGSHGMAWLLIILASAIVPRSWQDKAAGVTSLRLKRNRKLLDEDPLLWLIGERKGVRRTMWMLSSLWMLAVLVIGVVVPWNELDDGVIGPMAITGWIFLLSVKVLFAGDACRFFAETRRAGSFELLLAAPINANRFVSAQWTALRRTFGIPLLTALGGTISALAVSAAIHGESVDQTVTVTMFGALGAGLVLLVEALDFLALGWLGMWLALTMRKPHLAVGATLLYVIILPWVVFCYAWFVGFVLDIVLIAVFASKLHADFRLTLMNRPTLLSAAQGSST